MNVLIVEDDIGLSELISDVIMELDHEPKLCYTSTDAIEFLQINMPDLMILDYTLPDFNADELLNKLNSNKINIPPFVVSTGQGDERIAVEMMKKGARDYIVKDRHFLDILPVILKRIIKDIENENRKIEAELILKKQENYLKAIIETTTDGFFVLSKQGIINFANDSFCRMTGFNCDEIVGIKINSIDAIESIEETNTRISRIIDFGFELFETKHRRKDGLIFDVEMNVTYLDQDGGIFVCFTRDISERKKVENDIKIALQRAEESDKLKTAFLQNISHEIRTPLNGILGFSKLLNQENITKDEIKDFTEEILQSGYRLLETINNILDISKIETKQMIIEEKVFCVNDLILELHSSFEKITLSKKLHLKYYLACQGERCSIISDYSKIYQIFTNLLNNAIKFTHSGQIEFGYKIDKNEIKFFVKDTGIGIPIEARESIFDRFTQVDLSVSRGFEGAGLGLAICKGLVEILDGKIWFDSELGTGTCFYFALPYKSYNSSELLKDEINQSTGELPKKIKILIAEDDFSSYKFLISAIKNSNYEFLWAKNGKIAIDIAMQNLDIAIILMDVKMPILDGITATKEIRKFLPNVPIIAQTAYALSFELDEISNIGINGYLSKPIDIDDLKKILSNYVEIS